MTSTPLPEQEVKIPEYPNVPRWLILNGEIDFRIFMLDPLAESGIRKGEAMTLPEQGGFNERLDAIIVGLQVSIGKGLTKSSDLYKAKHEAKAAIRTLVLEEIVGENNLSFSIPQGMPESMYNRLKGKDDLRAEQRKKLEDTNGTK